MARLSVGLLSFIWGRIADSLATARKALEDLEKTHAKALKERLSTEERAIKAERALRHGHLPMTYFSRSFSSKIAKRDATFLYPLYHDAKPEKQASKILLVRIYAVNRH